MKIKQFTCCNYFNLTTMSAKVKFFMVGLEDVWFKRQCNVGRSSDMILPLV